MSNAAFSSDDLEAIVARLPEPLPARPVKVHAVFWGDSEYDAASYRSVVLELSDSTFALVQNADLTDSLGASMGRFFTTADAAVEMVDERVRRSGGTQFVKDVDAARQVLWGPSKYDERPLRKVDKRVAGGGFDLDAMLPEGLLDKPAGVAIQQIAQKALEQHPLVVGVTCSPDIAVAGDTVNLTAVLRLPYGADPADMVLVQLGQLLHQIVGECEDAAGDHPKFEVRFQAAPELNYPPTGIDTDDHDPWLEVKGAVMRELEPNKNVEALWHEARNGVGFIYCLMKDPYVEAPDVVSIGIRMQMQHSDKPLQWLLVGRVSDVPKAARCFFNPISRQLKAEALAKGDDVEGKILVPKAAQRIDNDLQQGIINARQKLPKGARFVRPRGSPHFKRTQLERGGLLEAGPTTTCRWCDLDVARSDNPAYTGKCGWCDALLSATTIATKNEHQPALQLWVNPDGTLWLDVLWAPKAPGRLDTSETWRYEISSALRQVFDENPLGMKERK